MKWPVDKTLKSSELGWDHAVILDNAKSSILGDILSVFCRWQRNDRSNTKVAENGINLKIISMGRQNQD